MTTSELVSSNITHLTDLLDKVANGALLDAFEQYYADDVVMHDQMAGTVSGKEANREREKAFVAAIASVEAFEVGPLMGGGDRTAYENRFAFTTTDGQSFEIKQVAVQTWRDGLIVDEHFYAASA